MNKFYTNLFIIFLIIFILVTPKKLFSFFTQPSHSNARKIRENFSFTQLSH